MLTDTTAPASPPDPPAAPPPPSNNHRLRVALVNHVSRVNSLSAYGTVTVSVIVVTGFFGVMFFLLVKPLGDLSDSMNAIMNIMLGALVTNFVGVVNYWIGSSAGSARKDATAEIPKPAPPTAAPVGATP